MPLAPTRTIPLGMADRVWRTVTRGEPDECWRWTAGTDGSGYGRLRLRDDTGTWRTYLAHRVAYVLHHGEPPADLPLIDHDCHNADSRCGGGTRCEHRRCCNPRHLVARTAADNSALRGQRARTHCHQGHPLDGLQSGRRYCKTCHADRERTRQARLVREVRVVLPADLYDTLRVMAGDGRGVGRLARDLLVRAVDDLVTA